MCGILGIYNHENAAELCALGLFAEQHRGQESCGMAVSDGKVFRLRRKMGLVKDVFDPQKMSYLRGHIAVGHVRYPTCGAANAFNSQPHVVETLAGPCYALASNGDVVNYWELRKQLEEKGVHFASDNDGELLLKIIAYEVEKNKMPIPDAIKLLMKKVRGAYSTILATRTELYFFRDPLAIRPMIYGQMENGTAVIASESCALDILDAEALAEVPPAGIMMVDANGFHDFPNDPDLYRSTKTCKHCVFEHIYFSRPDSYEFGENVFEVREAIGAKLADADDDIDPDVVVPVPDSSNFIALGYAKRKKKTFEMGLIRNHYMGRTFIKPEQKKRDESVRQKFNPLPNFFEGKSVVLVDDSIVRGTTVKKIVGIIKNQGAREIHLRIGSPPVTHSCHYGIDTPTREELIANRKTIDGIVEFLGVTSLRYLEISALESCVEADQYCYACFNGEYPIGVKS